MKKNIKIQRVFIVGAGTMGQQIGFQCAMYGFSVFLYDISSLQLETALNNIREYATQVISSGKILEQEAKEALNRISTTTDISTASTVDLVSESIPEDPKLKGKIFAQLNKICPAHTIFTTNTSTLVPSMFAKESGRPSQLIALHFHQPVWYANVVDIMPHSGTDSDVINLVTDFARQIGQITIFSRREHSGYVFNTMFNALNTEAISMAAQGLATIEDIDRSWMGVMKTPIGPFGILDLVGIDTVLKITQYWAKRLFWRRNLATNATFLKGLVDRGWLGVKTTRGFYQYPDPAYSKAGFLEGELTNSS